MANINSESVSFLENIMLTGNCMLPSYISEILSEILYVPIEQCVFSISLAR